jgi:hypothetical protein
MRTLYQTLILSVGALVLVATGFAQVPSSNDTSDGNLNTGMGSLALGGPVATRTPDTRRSNTTGTYNTGTRAPWDYAGALFGNDNSASGFSSLYSNTTGGSNTASGYGSLFSNVTGSYNTASGYRTLFE